MPVCKTSAFEPLWFPSLGQEYNPRANLQFPGVGGLLCTRESPEGARRPLAPSPHVPNRSASKAGKFARDTPAGRLYSRERVWSRVIKRRKKWLIAKMQWLMTLLCPFDCLGYLQSCHVGIYLAINLLQNGFSSPPLGRIFHWGYCGVKLMKHWFPFAQMLAFPCINSLWLEVRIRLETREFFCRQKGIIPVSQWDAALNSEPWKTKTSNLSPHYP